MHWYPGVYSRNALVLVLLVQLTLHIHTQRTRKTYTKLAQSEPPPISEALQAPESENVTTLAQHIKKHGGASIIVFNLVRSASTLALLCMSVYSAIKVPDHSTTPGPRSFEIVFHVSTCITYLYASALSVVPLLVGPILSTTIVRHLNCILFTAWSAYAYRDLWPLATFTLVPMDLEEGALLWAKLSLLTVSGIFVPILIPRWYIPFDPENPWPVPSPEQTSSIMSFLLYTWLEPTVRLGSRVKHLTIDMLPPLADYDEAQNLMKRSADELDPLRVKKKGRHLMWGILRVFRTFKFSARYPIHLIVSTISSLHFLLQSCWLRYIETDGVGAIIRPCFWITMLLVGDIGDYVLGSIYIYISSRLLTRVEAIITQLVFEHALRMRMKADISDDVGNSEGNITASGTLDTAYDSESSATAAQEIGSDNDSDSSAGKGKQKSTTAQTMPLPGHSENTNKAGVQAKVKRRDDDTEGKNVVGKINNLISSDLASLSLGREFLAILVRFPVKLIFSIWFLYAVLGWSAFVGLASIIVLYPIPGMLATVVRDTQIAKMKKTDARVQTATDTMSVIRMIKLFGWESRVAAKIGDKREEELQSVKKNRVVDLVNNNLTHIIPLLTMAVTYATYVSLLGQLYDTHPCAVFDSLRHLMHMVFDYVPMLIRAKVSLDRVDDFLQEAELLDQYSEQSDESHTHIVTQHEEDVIGFRNASFTWTKEASSVLSTPGSGKRNFTLRIDDLVFKSGRINLIVGPTGSGKTSLLMALLGEMHYIPTSPESFYNLPRTRGIAYAAQESWVQNETIRDNILFGASFNEERYHKVIEQCALKRDLEMFAASDKTEVGERGITLSGGQKARITLARAIYSEAQTLLLDDVLAALDVHTSRWIVEKCLKGDLVCGRTVLLVTHNILLASPIADFVVALGANGTISSQGLIANALEHDKALATEVAKEEAEIEKAEATVDEQVPEEATEDGKLVVEEEVTVGHVGWQAMRLYISRLGGNHQVFFWSSFIGGLLLSSLLTILETWFLGFWARQYEEMPASQVIAPYFIGGYGLIMITAILSYMAAFYVYMYGSLRASRVMHNELISSLLAATLR
ncbi:uncharacterized protein C8Q71DRAFT_703286 [Rhodofomes roseus]|uniref:P-loop containing nucleoside triphosphate hydrolase protein n=1 Tax=Rhodofomes roseus TaxID=34475 RepID=A0ABQ8KPJ1_9APHY|nr:uncharacterized protein C8Q71DRAFT_703286 [Rhodofomes roseus]KAH9840299.1 hypothetical protein C8Q71DRAFT_703286 [Rhodofomes roseus]